MRHLATLVLLVALFIGVALAADEAATQGGFQPQQPHPQTPPVVTPVVHPPGNIVKPVPQQPIKKQPIQHKKKEHNEIVSFENPNCLKWGEKPKKICLKRDPKSCEKTKHKKVPYCAAKTPYCAKYEVRVSKTCKARKPYCKEWQFKQHSRCVKKQKVCSGIKYKQERKKVFKNGKCQKWVYHRYPVCSKTSNVCWKYGANESAFCKNKVRKCIEKGIKQGKPQCAKFASVYRRGQKYCTQFAQKSKCVQYQRKKYCAKYKTVSFEKHQAKDKKDLVLQQKQHEDKNKKCVKWKFYYPHKKVRKCVEYHKEKVCDIKISLESKIMGNDNKFLPSSHQSKCLRFAEVKTSKCIKFKIVKSKICTKKVPVRSVCKNWAYPIVNKQICVAFKTPYKFYCKKYATFCNDFGKKDHHYCKEHKQVCKKYKFAKKRLYCLHHARIAEYKTIQKPVCDYTEQCVEQKSYVTRTCKVQGKKCIKYKLNKTKYCAKREEKCTSIAYRKGKKYCAKHRKGSCRSFGSINKKVCLQWKNKVPVPPKKPVITHPVKPVHPVPTPAAHPPAPAPVHTA